MGRIILKFQLVLMAYLFAFSAPTASAGEKPVTNISEIERTIVAICHSVPSLNNHTGTGFIASQEGVVVTADHVIQDRNGNIYDRLFCIRPSHPHYEKYELVLLKRLRDGQRGRDIAILRIKNESQHGTFPYLSIGETFENGQSVLTAGFPNVFKAIYLWPLLRRGSVSSTRYKYENSDIIVLDMKSSEGYSGAPIIAEKSLQVIGVMKGKNIKSSQGDFSVASPIKKTDLEINNSKR
jgi:S1-C subfamily serine protease